MTGFLIGTNDKSYSHSDLHRLVKDKLQAHEIMQGGILLKLRALTEGHNNDFGYQLYQMQMGKVPCHF